VRPKRTPLQEQLHNVGVVMAGVAISVAPLVLIIGVVRGERDPSKPENAPWLQFLMLSVSIAVSAIPEGLPLVVTICLALGTTSMAEHHALIRKLPAVETLGSASVVCSDKTGTLTTGKMTAVAAWCAGVHYTITGAGLAPEGHFFLGHGNAGKQLQLADASARGLVTTLLVAGSCSNARIAFRAEDKMWVAFGSSTEAAIVVAAAKLGLAAEALEKIMPRVDEVAFNSSRKMMTTVHQLRDAELKHAPAPVAAALTALAGAHHALVFAKGAPNVLIERCSHVQSPSGDTGMLNEAARGHIMESVDAMSSQGLRVLACAYRPLSAPLEGQAEMTAEQKHERLPRDMVFCGLIGIMDPPREGVANSVARARGAGVRTVMITGDYVKTAVAIARMVGILDPTADSVDSSVDCSALRPEGVYLSDPDIDAITRRVNVFARARPEDKIYVVRSFQRQGLVCAMTGDGVNDAPALKQADIGVAMGLAGSEVAKSAGDMILTDDDFTSIINAVERGRTIYANIQKFVMYLIGTNWAQLIVVFSCVVAGLPAPLEPLQILFINLATDGMPAVALSVEAPEDNIMRMPPRRRREPIIHRRLAINTAVHAVTLAALMVLIFALGLYWHIGDVLITNMFVSEKELISTCRKLRGDSSFKTINDEDCVETGLRQARTMVFLTLALSENMRPLTVRNFQDSLFHRLFDNKHMLRAVSASTALVMFVTFTPGVQDVFSLTEIEWWDWLLVLLAVIITVVVDEANKSNLRTAAKERRRWNRLFGMLESISLDIRTVQHHVSRDPAAKTPAPDLPGLRRLSRAFNELVDRYEFDEKSTTKAD
jgi:potassium/sodium efflux P-type ATPase